MTGPADVLTDLQQIDPIYVYFSPSDLELLRLRREQAEGKLVFPTGASCRWRSGSRTGRRFRRGPARLRRPVASNSRTGTQQFRAEFRNPQHILLPGQFVRVRILGVTRKGAILVPQRAVLQGLAGAYVYVLTEGDTARARTVTATTWEGNGWVIETGLNAGERVVVDGTQRSSPGSRSGSPRSRTRPRADTTP